MDKESVVIFNEMKEVIEDLLIDGDAWVEKGTKSSGIRARKATLQLDKLGKSFRKASVAESKN